MPAAKKSLIQQQGIPIKKERTPAADSALADKIAKRPKLSSKDSTNDGIKSAYLKAGKDERKRIEKRLQNRRKG